MAIHSVADLLTKGVQRVRLSKNRLAQSARSKTAFRRFLDHKNDFIHASGPKTCLESFRDLAFIGKNALGNRLSMISFLRITNHLSPRFNVLTIQRFTWRQPDMCLKCGL